MTLYKGVGFTKALFESYCEIKLRTVFRPETDIIVMHAYVQGNTIIQQILFFIKILS